MVAILNVFMLFDNRMGAKMDPSRFSIKSMNEALRSSIKNMKIVGRILC